MTKCQSYTMRGGKCNNNARHGGKSCGVHAGGGSRRRKTLLGGNPNKLAKLSIEKILNLLRNPKINKDKFNKMMSELEQINPTKFDQVMDAWLEETRALYAKLSKMKGAEKKEMFFNLPSHQQEMLNHWALQKQKKKKQQNQKKRKALELQSNEQDRQARIIESKIETITKELRKRIKWNQQGYYPEEYYDKIERILKYTVKDMGNDRKGQLKELEKALKKIKSYEVGLWEYVEEESPVKKNKKTSPRKKKLKRKSSKGKEEEESDDDVELFD